MRPLFHCVSLFALVIVSSLAEPLMPVADRAHRREGAGRCSLRRGSTASGSRIWESYGVSTAALEQDPAAATVSSPSTTSTWIAWGVNGVSVVLPSDDTAATIYAMSDTTPAGNAWEDYGISTSTTSKDNALATYTTLSTILTSMTLTDVASPILASSASSTSSMALTDSTILTVTTSPLIVSTITSNTEISSFTSAISTSTVTLTTETISIAETTTAIVSPTLLTTTSPSITLTTTFSSSITSSSATTTTSTQCNAICPQYYQSDHLISQDNYPLVNNGIIICEYGPGSQYTELCTYSMSDGSLVQGAPNGPYCATMASCAKTTTTTTTTSTNGIIVPTCTPNSFLIQIANSGNENIDGKYGVTDNYYALDQFTADPMQASVFYIDSSMNNRLANYPSGCDPSSIQYAAHYNGDPHPSVSFIFESAASVSEFDDDPASCQNNGPLQPLTCQIQTRTVFGLCQNIGGLFFIGIFTSLDDPAIADNSDTCVAVDLLVVPIV